MIWRPPIEPVKIATQPPRPGDLLTIHGYGRGQYRIATGRCTTYYAPQPQLSAGDGRARRRSPARRLGRADLQPTRRAGRRAVRGRAGDHARQLCPAREQFPGVAGAGHRPGQFDRSQVAVADRPAPNVRLPIDDECRDGIDRELPELAVVASRQWSAQQSTAARERNTNGCPAGANSVRRNQSSVQRLESRRLVRAAQAGVGWYDVAAMRCGRKPSSD